MDVLPMQFRVLNVFGLWYENPEKYRLLKTAYRVLIFATILQFMVTQYINMIKLENLDIATLADVIYLLFLYVAFYFKMLIFVWRRNSVVDLLDKLRSSMCQPRDEYEETTLKKYLRVARNIYYYRTIVGTLSCTMFFIAPTVKAKRLTLPIPVTYFDVTNDFRLIIAYFLQFSAVYTCSTNEVFLDSTVVAFIILIGAQMEFCRHRLVVGNGLNNKTSVKDFVSYHVHIQDIIRKVQSTFMAMILPVFCFGLITLCTSLFKFTQISTILLDRLFCSLYLAYLMYPIYVYAYHGHSLQLMNESIADAVYESNWISLKPSERKNNWYVMFISQKKLEISYKGQCILALQTFLWMMKTSYGAFNLLQQVSGDEK